MKSELQDTGFFVDANQQISGPIGITGFQIDGDGYLLRDGRRTGVFVEDSYFFKPGRLLRFLSGQTGHKLEVDGKILGDPFLLPWQGR
jgi:hypothetical protein